MPCTGFDSQIHTSNIHTTLDHSEKTRKVPAGETVREIVTIGPGPLWQDISKKGLIARMNHSA